MIFQNQFLLKKNKGSNEILTHSKGKEKILNNSEGNSIKLNSTEQRNLAENSVKNFPKKFLVNLDAYETNFLGLRIRLKQTLEVDHLTDLRKEKIKLTLGGSTIDLADVKIYHDPYNPSGNYNERTFDGEKYALTRSFSVFGYEIKSSLYLLIHIKHGVNYRVNSGQMYTKGYAFYEISISASYGPNFIFASFGASINGKIVNGNSYIQGNSISGSDLARFESFRDFKASSISIYFYFSFYILWWKTIIDSTVNIHKNNAIYEREYSLL